MTNAQIANTGYPSGIRLIPVSSKALGREIDLRGVKMQFSFLPAFGHFHG